MTTSYDDNVGLAINIIFAIIGGFGYLLLPKIRKPIVVDGCNLNHEDMTWSGLFARIMGVLSLWSMGYYMIFVIVYEIDQHFLSQATYTEGYRIFVLSLGMGLILALGASLAPRIVWPIILFYIVAESIAIRAESCDSSLCYFLRLVVVFIITGLISTVSCCFLAQFLTPFVSKAQMSIASSFALVYGTAQALKGYAYWIDEQQPVYLLIAVVGMGFIRHAYIELLNRYMWCGGFAIYMKNDLDYEQIKFANGDIILDEPPV